MYVAINLGDAVLHEFVAALAKQIPGGQPWNSNREVWVPRSTDKAVITRAVGEAAKAVGLPRAPEFQVAHDFVV